MSITISHKVFSLFANDIISFIPIRKKNEEYLAGQELDAAAIRLLFDPDKQNRADFKVKELERVNVAPERVIINSLNPLRIKHRVLTCR